MISFTRTIVPLMLIFSTFCCSSQPYKNTGVDPGRTQPENPGGQTQPETPGTQNPDPVLPDAGAVAISEALALGWNMGNHFDAYYNGS